MRNVQCYCYVYVAIYGPTLSTQFATIATYTSSQSYQNIPNVVVVVVVVEAIYGVPACLLFCVV